MTPRARALSLPPLSSDGIEMSSPLVGSKAEKAAKSRQKSQRKRAMTLKTQKGEAALNAYRLSQEKEEQLTALATKKAHFFDDIISSLKNHGYTIGELLLYISDPLYKQAATRWESLFRDNATVEQVLNLWAFRSSEMSRWQVHRWAVDYVSTKVKEEAATITKLGILQTFHRPVDSKLVLSFEMTEIQARLQKHGTVFMQVFQSLATSARQLKNAGPVRIAKKMNVSSANLYKTHVLTCRLERS